MVKICGDTLKHDFYSKPDISFPFCDVILLHYSDDNAMPH